MNGKEDLQLEMDLRPPSKPAPELEPEPTPKITEAMVKAIEKDVQLADAMDLSPEDYAKAQAANNADVFLAIEAGCSVNDALALVKLDES